MVAVVVVTNVLETEMLIVIGNNYRGLCSIHSFYVNIQTIITVKRQSNNLLSCILRYCTLEWPRDRSMMQWTLQCSFLSSSSLPGTEYK